VATKCGLAGEVGDLEFVRDTSPYLGPVGSPLGPEAWSLGSDCSSGLFLALTGTALGGLACDLWLDCCFPLSVGSTDPELDCTV